jgi:hypothetical protein
VGDAATELGAVVLGYYSSGLAGPKGNLETFIRLSDTSRHKSAGDLRRLIAKVEP